MATPTDPPTPHCLTNFKNRTLPATQSQQLQDFRSFLQTTGIQSCGKGGKKGTGAMDVTWIVNKMQQIGKKLFV